MERIEVEKLKYRYPLTETNALDDVSFTISEGEFIGIVGENNAGKSTLCQALVGLVPHFYKGLYDGKVMVCGKNVRESSVSELSENVGLAFQNPFTQVTGAKVTVYEEVAFGLENLGIPRDEMEKRVTEALELLGISEYRDRNPFDLSGGQMQRVALAGVIAMKPDVIILDEPTSQLDPKGSEEVFQAVQQLSEKGMTIIMVEHKMEKIAAYSDRVMLLSNGKVVDFATPHEIFSREDIHDYGVIEPVYTQVAKGLGLILENGLYPVTVTELSQLMKGER
ncbi:energy-coupling factor ABC transporter ATP-binding protein [Vagococcus sp. PNs007]|uniref:Energy-coupling factor ABC transporter ATP-binding protein n=1 Tax=Vagococcus proximus TaxID=2991417 RepID=A0ABT5X2Z2_9ENTE|nr:ABC transporter ATP-binding protein [Vagococcus proximus]MDF0480343.1 energy-coupling factor ABC transporter ATP-binding protein [Vagococcus proximus]